MFSPENYALTKQKQEKDYSDFESLKKGRRNLLINTNFLNGLSGWNERSGLKAEIVNENEVKISNPGLNTITRFQGNQFNDNGVMPFMESGQTFTLSCESKGDPNGESRVRLYDYKSESGTDIGIIAYKQGEWQKNELTFTFDEPKSSGEVTLQFFSGDEKNESIRFLRNIKIEKGRKASPYTLSPMDLNADEFIAETAESVYQKEDNRKRVEELESVVSELGGNK